MKMTVTQKARAMKRIAMEIEEYMAFDSMEMSSFGAPSECWNMTNLWVARRVERALEALDSTASEIEAELERHMKLEGPHSFGKFPWGVERVPSPAYEALFALDLNR